MFRLGDIECNFRGYLHIRPSVSDFYEVVFSFVKVFFRLSCVIFSP